MIFSIFVFITTIFVTIISTSFIGLNGLYIKRTVINIPFALFQEAIHVNASNNDLIVFDMDIVEVNVKSYLDHELKEKCENYKFKLWPYKFNELEEAIYNDDPETVEHFQLHFKGYYTQKRYIETYASYSIIEKSVTNE